MDSTPAHGTDVDDDAHGTDDLAPAHLAAAWRGTRPPRALVHLDSAAAGRSSRAVLAATAGHALREAEVGGYVAAAAAADVLERARDDVRALLGWPAGEGAVAFVHGAGDALAQLLLSWPGGVPATAAHAPGEYGPNTALLHRVGVAPVLVPGPHRLDPAAFERALAGRRPDLVHVTWVGSHVGTVQPAAQVAAVCAAAGVPVVLEPVSVAKAARLHTEVQDLLLVTPNTDEIGALVGRPHDPWSAVADLHGRGVEHVWMREGGRGSYVCTRDERPVHLPAVPVEVVDVTGAGDAMLAAWIAAWLGGADPVEAARDGHRAAAATVASPHTVRPDLAEAMAALEPPTPREVTDVDDH